MFASLLRVKSLVTVEDFQRILLPSCRQAKQVPQGEEASHGSTTWNKRFPLPPPLRCCHSQHPRSGGTVYHLMHKSQSWSSTSPRVVVLVDVSAPAVSWTLVGSVSLVLSFGSLLVAWACWLSGLSQWYGWTRLGEKNRSAMHNCIIWKQVLKCYSQVKSSESTSNSVKFSVCLSAGLCAFLSQCSSICLSVCLSTGLYVPLFKCLSVCLRVYLSVLANVPVFFCLTVCLPAFLS